MNKKILVTGSQGLVGSRFVELYRDKEILLTPTIEEFNLLNFTSMEKYFRRHDICTVVNFAAFTDVSASEKERGDKKGICWKVNVNGVKSFTKVLGRNSVKFIHISTDMVFSGSEKDPGPYIEDHVPTDEPDKLTWYGFTKSEGERILNQYFNNLATLRIIYPVRAKYSPKLDYLRKPLKLYKEGKLYPLFYDQQISITFIDEACEVISKLIAKNSAGIYHCCSTDTSTPYDIVQYLIEAKYRVKDPVKSISIYKFLKNEKFPIRYPVFGGLKADKTQTDLKVHFSNWRNIVNNLIKQGISA